MWVDEREKERVDVGGDGSVNLLRMRIAGSSSVREFGRENFLQVEFRVAVLF